ncbi:MAG TPA: prolyl oligopeptidase family serine peptidase [Bryobacteraceae bacterium]|jgi:esterase/lipase superfamily enzyme
MRRDYHNWYSPRLDRQMELLTFGAGGLPIVIFPTERGRFYDYENNGMIQAVSGPIEEGRIQMFCVDSVDAESWLNRGLHPHERLARHLAYESYVLYEVAPLMKKLSGSAQIGATGCGLGGYHAFNFAMKHPDLTAASIAMSGFFDMRRFMDGFYSNDFYFNNPFDYLPNMSDTWFLERYAKMRLILAVGDRDVCLAENVRMKEILSKRDIPCWLDVWQNQEMYDWPLWQRMAVKFF